MIINSTNFTETGQVVSNQITAHNIEYYGVSVRETSGSAGATVTIYSGDDNTGRVLETISLLANESTRELYPHGIESDGMYVEVTGDVVGSLRYST